MLDYSAEGRQAFMEAKAVRDALFSRIVAPAEIQVLSRSGTGGGRTVAAYAAVFSTPAEIMDRDGHYREQIAPGAFARSLTERRGKIFCLYNHGKTLTGESSEIHSVPIGRPVTLREDPRGLYTETCINQGDVGDQVLEAARNGALTGMSFTGVFARSDPQKGQGERYGPGWDGGLQLVTRKEIILSEYGMTPVPAYQDAQVVGVRSQVTTSGPAPYQKDDGDTLQCPACLLYNGLDAEFCDQCGAALPGFGSAYQQHAAETVGCPNCGSGNMPDARYCDQCGKLLPHSSYEASLAAAGAQQAAATSSGGRLWSSGERERYHAATLDQEDRRQRTEPPLTGDRERDGKILDEAEARCEAYWSRAVKEYLAAQVAEEYPVGETLAERRQLRHARVAAEAVAGVAWQDYQGVKALRSQVLGPRQRDRSADALVAFYEQAARSHGRER